MTEGEGEYRWMPCSGTTCIDPQNLQFKEASGSLWIGEMKFDHEMVNVSRLSGMQRKPIAQMKEILPLSYTNGDQTGNETTAITRVSVCSIKYSGIHVNNTGSFHCARIVNSITASNVAIRLLYKPHTAIDTRRVTPKRNITPVPE
jgi:hypothetical protein